MITGNNTVVGITNASAAERAQVSRAIPDPARHWISCAPLADGTTYTVGDVASAGTCLTLPVGSVSPGDIREVYLSNVQRTSPFNRLNFSQTGIDTPCPGCRVIEGGMPTTGLQVEFVSRNPNPTFSWSRDIVPADNRLSGFQGCDLIADVGPTLDQVFAGDFWRPGIDRQITPWTRPSVYTYNTLGGIPANVRGAFFAGGLHAIDDIRQGSGTNIDFTYYRTYTNRPVAYVREDWWITQETNGLATFTNLTVEGDATLHVEPDAILVVNGTLLVEKDAALDVRGDIRFGPEGRLVVEGSMTGTDAFLTAQNPARGWRGVRFAGSGTAVWTGVTVEKVVLSSYEKFSPVAAVSLYGRELLATNSFVTGTRTDGFADRETGGGYYVAGAGGSLVVSGGRVEDNVGIGIRVGAGGAARTAADLSILGNGGAGVLSEGTNASVTLSKTLIQENRGVGVVARLGARVAFNPGNGQTVTVDRNVGGLLSTNGADLNAGLCRRLPCPREAHTISQNATVAGLRDAEALVGSVLYAQGNTWGPGITSVSQLSLYADANSYLDVVPIISNGVLGPAPRAADAPALVRDGTAAGRGIAAAPLFALATAILADGDTLGAAQAVTGALDAADDDSDRQAAYEAASRLAGLVQPPTLVGRLETEAVTAGPVQAWARRALLAAYEATGDSLRADAVAGALVAGHVGTEHEAEGWAARVRLAAHGRNEDAAVAAFEALDARFPDTDVSNAAAATVAAAFAPEDVAGRGVAPRVAAADAPKTFAAGDVTVGPVAPNPASGRVFVDVTAPTESTASVEIFDALGRNVGQAATGAAGPAGGRVTLDVSGLAPGVYVARVTVRAGEQAATVSRRFVVAR